MKLVQSPVVFNEEEHSYTLNGVELSGITPILSKYLFPQKYDGVPPAILERAKQRGSIVHNQLECLYLWGYVPFEETRAEVKAYHALAAEQDFHQISAEYLVCDEQIGVASKIDSVLQAGPNSIDLIDYKTTSQIDKNYLSWQLSIYAHLFEKQNPGVFVRNLYGIHLKGDKARCIDIKRVPDFAVQRLLMTYALGGESFDNPLQRSP